MIKKPWTLRQRKKRYVSHAIQGRFITRLIFYWFLYHAFLLHALFLSNGLLVDDVPQSFANRYWSFLGDHSMLVVCAIAVFPMIAWDMVKLTHRVVGPLVRLERTLKDMTNGKQVATIKLRNRDLVKEFVGVFNDFITSHNARVAERPEGTAATNGEPDKAMV